MFSRVGKIRLRRWYNPASLDQKVKIIADVTSTILARKPNMCNFLEYKSQKLVYRRYASLYFCFCIEADDNELITLEVIQRFVCCLDSYFGNVCELGIIWVI